MTQTNLDNKRGYNSLVIRIAGYLLMIADYVFSFVVKDNIWLSQLEWTAFPIFAFLLAEGVRHTSNIRLYIRRFTLFAVFSEFSYDFLMHQKFLEFTDQNPMLTLLYGLLCLGLINYVREKLHNSIATAGLSALLIWFSSMLLPKLHFFMGKYAVLILVLFYISTVVTYGRIFQLLALFVAIPFMTGQWLSTQPIGGYIYSVPAHIFMLFSLPIIWGYNGKRGPNDMGSKIAFYLIYPVTMLLIGIVNIAF